MQKNEFILCAAIWIKDGLKHRQQPKNIEAGFVICGRRHNNCYQTIIDLKGDLKSLCENQQGFMTSFDRFVDRKEAFEIAKRNNQIEASKDNNILISENLY